MLTITVITPVYKVEQYLDRCVESILAQSFKDFELILVDDGSPDNCPKMCDAWAEKDARIRVIHQENQGQAAARNKALDIAKGNYIAFVDSDDYVHSDYLSVLYDNICETESDISVVRYVQVDGDDSQEPELGTANTFLGSEYVRKTLLREIDGSAWLLCDKLYKNECWKNVRLPVGRIYEDNATVYKLLYEASKVVDCDTVLYNYFTNPESTVNKKYSYKNLDWLLVPQEMIEYFAEKGDEVLLAKANKMYLSALEDMLRKVRLNLSDKALEKELYQKLKKQYKSEKKKYPIIIKTHPSLFETLYPKRMKMYWIFKGLQNKFKR